MTESALGGKLKLNLGCGKRRREGFINVDSQPGCQPDLVLDLEALPWPWADDSVDEVDLIHVLEHLGQSPCSAPGSPSTSIRWSSAERPPRNNFV